MLPSDSSMPNLYSQLGHFCRGVLGFATNCPCWVWCHGLITHLLYVSPVLRYLYLYNSWSVSLTYWMYFHCFCFCYTHIFTSILMFRNILIWTGPFKFRWSRGYIYNSSYYRNQIGSVNLSQCCHIFPWLCALSCCTTICCRFHIYIYISWGSWVLFLWLLCSLMMCANNRVHHGLMVVIVCLHITLPHYHHYTDVSEGIELLKCLSGTFCRVCV